MRSMCSMRSMRGGIIFRNWGPLLKVHHGQCLTRMTKHDSGESPPRAACDSAKQPHGKNTRFHFRMAEPIKPISTELSLSLAPQRLLQCPGDFNSEGPLPLSMGSRLPLEGVLSGGEDSPALCQVKPDQPAHK
jgi:hypothetical protein